VIERVTTKTGTSSNGREWCRWDIKIAGEWYGTFSETIGQAAEMLRDREVEVCYTVNAKGYNTITILQEMGAPAGADGTLVDTDPDDDNLPF
jgi:hypothetical protein